MATPSPSHEFLRSRFENVLQILPEGHDKALKQAFYSTAATLFVILVCGAGVAVYHILLPFLRPLLWALLCGTVLFPLKYTLVNLSRGWLKGLRESGTPLVVGTALLPVTMVDAGVASFCGVARMYALPIVVGGLVLPALYLIIYVCLGRAFLDAAVAVFMFIYNTLGYFSALWVWSLVIVYVIALFVLWTPQRNGIFKLLSVPIWTAVLFHLATIFGPFRVPIVFGILTLVCVSCVSGIRDASQSSTVSGDAIGPCAALCGWLASFVQSRKRPVSEGSEPASDMAASEDEMTADVDECSSELDKIPAASDATDSSTAGTLPECQKESKPSGSGKPTAPSTLPVKPGDVPQLSKRKRKKKSLGDYCLIWLLWSLVIVHMWIYKFFFFALPILVVYFAIRKLGEYLGFWVWLRASVGTLLCRIRDRVLNDPRFDAVLPKSVRRVAVWFTEADGKVLVTLEGLMDKLISILIICLLLVSVVLVALFAALEIHRESMHLVHLSSNIMNKTMHPELAQWLPDQDVMESTLDSVVGNAYIYGREWISNKMRDALSGDEASKEQVERQVLKIWDKIYESWFAKNKSSVDGTADHSSSSQSLSRQLSLDLSDISSVSDLAQKLQPFNLDIIAFAKENVGIFLSVLESLWSILVSNVALFVNVIFSIVSLIFGGGTAILNSLLEVVVFLTALFYLLSSSSQQYKPIEMFAGLSPTLSGSSNELAFGKAFEDAIGSVFLASLKMAVFYGLYTWLTHTLFGVEIIFIPSVLAAILAAVPFLGTYFAAIPAVIDLWLVNGYRFEAAAIFVAHYVPTLFVDTAIYSEIKGGHPYMTGLAVAGGIYWMGLEGAIVGPVLLCCLIVAVNMYQSFLKSDATSVSKTGAHQSLSMGATDKRVKFNFLRGGHASTDTL